MNMQNDINLLPGLIVGFYSKSHFSFGMVVSVSGNEIVIKTPESGESAIPTGRIMLAGKEVFCGKVENFVFQVEQKMADADLESIWNKVNSNQELLSFEDLCSGQTLDDVSMFALFLALAQDRQYFQAKGRMYLPRSPEQREKFLAEAELVRQKEAYLGRIESYIDAVAEAFLTGKAVQPDELLSDIKPDFEADLYEHLALKPLTWLRKILRQVTMRHFPSIDTDTDHQVTRIVLWTRQNLQQTDEHTPERLALSGLPVLFSSSIECDVLQIKPFELTPDYRDLTNLPCLTIDAPETRDRDDALSAVKTDRGWQVGIHISEVESFVPANSRIDDEAYLRTTSVYLPECDVPMLPEEISYNLGSLRLNTIRPVLSLVLELSEEMEIVKAEFTRAAICVTRQLTYQICDEILSNESNSNAKITLQQPDADDATCDTLPDNEGRDGINDTIILLNQLASLHKARRMAAGAVISASDDATPARKLVAELMVIYNSFAAQKALRAEVPFLYRCLEDKIKTERDNYGIEHQIIPASVLTFQPVKHQAMGLEIYAQVTSPIRRYADLINQRQLRALIDVKTLPYTKDDLQSMLLHLNQTRRKIKQL